MRLRVFFAWSFAMMSMGSLSLVRAEGTAAASAAPTAHGTIKIARLSGEVFAIDHATGLKTRLSVNSLVSDGQTVETGADASVVLVFSNGAVVNVRANSKISVNEFLQNPFASEFRVKDAIHEPSVSTTNLELVSGEIVCQVKKLNRDAGSSFTVETPMGAAGIRGTAFLLGYHVDSGAARFVLSMAEGLIQFIPVKGRPVDVPAGKEVSSIGFVDVSSGKITSMSDVSTLFEITPSNQAELQQSIADVLGASLKVEFTPTVSNTTTNPGAANNSTGPGVGSSNPSNSSDPTASPSSNNSPPDTPLASPPAVPPAPRTTPNQGD